MRGWLLMLLLLAMAPSLQAVVETYEFSDEITRERYQHFIADLRCPKCQNQNLAGSDAPIAEDLRRELYRMLESGSSDKEIIDFMVSRYGDFVLYKPRFNRETALLWLAPGLFLLLGLAVALVIYRRQKNSRIVEADDAPLTAEERQRLSALLDEGDGGTND